MAAAATGLLWDIALRRGWSPQPGTRAPITVCAYSPSPGEPGGAELVEVLHSAVDTVLLPVTPPASETTTGPQPLDWARFNGREAMAAGRFGISEPTGPRLGASAIAAADAVLVPALAADRRGYRLGRGGGFYDRTLELVGSETLLLCLVDSADIVDAVPVESHDLAVHAVISESGVLWTEHAEETGHSGKASPSTE